MLPSRCLPVLALLGGCKAVEIPEKITTVDEVDALEGLFTGSRLLFDELESVALGAGYDLESDFQGDWPLDGSATLRPGRSSVGTTFVVDRTEMGWPQREWSVELQLEPLVVDGIRYTGVLQGSWVFEDYQDALLVEHAFTGEVDWEGADDQTEGAGAGTVAFAARTADGVWTLRDGRLGDTLLVEGDLGRR